LNDNLTISSETAFKRLVIDGPVVHAISVGQIQFISSARVIVDLGTGRIIEVQEIKPTT